MRTDPFNRRVLLVLAGIGLLGLVLHGFNIWRVTRFGATVGTDYHIGPDTPSYSRMAQAIRDGGRQDPMYQERMLVPLILAGLRAAGLEDALFPWVVALLVVPTTVAVGWMGWLLGARARAAYVSALLFVMYPTAYQYGVLVETDTLHLYLAVMALACTINGMKTGSRATLATAACLWPLAHLVRPSLWGLMLFLPFFLWKRLADRKTRNYALAACAGIAFVPLLFSALNLARFGIISPSLHQAEILHVWTCSRVGAFIETRKTGEPMSPLFNRAVSRARKDPRWPVIHGAFDRPEEFRDAYTSLLEDSRNYLRLHRKEMFHTTWSELRHQLTASWSYYNRYNAPSLDILYPDVHKILHIVFQLAGVFSVFGLCFVFAGKNRDVVLFVLLGFVLMFIPSSLSCWAGARMRMVMDAMLIPFVVAAASLPLSWKVVGALLVGAYLPRRWGASHGYYRTVSAMLVLTGGFLSFRLGKKEGKGKVE